MQLNKYLKNTLKHTIHPKALIRPISSLKWTFIKQVWFVRVFTLAIFLTYVFQEEQTSSSLWIGLIFPRNVPASLQSFCVLAFIVCSGMSAERAKVCQTGAADTQPRKAAAVGTGRRCVSSLQEALHSVRHLHAV